MDDRNRIKSWSEDDRPREKLLLKGRHNLSNAELLAIILGHGTKRKSAVDLAREILALAGDDLSELARKNVKELCSVSGVGNAKAVSVLAALELAMRKKPSLEKPCITKSSDAFSLLAPVLEDLNYEEFWVLLLNRGNRLISRERISEGGITGTVIDPRRLFKLAIEHRASSIILCHNHPSGQLRPSEADLGITKQLKEAGKLLEISILDHLIVTNRGYLSFADEGLM